MAPADKHHGSVAKVAPGDVTDVERGLPAYNEPVIAQVTVPNQSFLEGDGFNIQWLLFVLGFFCWITSLVACFLPLCRRPRFPSRSYKAGWIANMVLTHVTLALLIVVIVLCIVYSISFAQMASYYR